MKYYQHCLFSPGNLNEVEGLVSWSDRKRQLHCLFNLLTVVYCFKSDSCSSPIKILCWMYLNKSPQIYICWTPWTDFLLNKVCLNMYISFQFRGYKISMRINMSMRMRKYSICASYSTLSPWMTKTITMGFFSSCASNFLSVIVNEADWLLHCLE